MKFKKAAIVAKPHQDVVHYLHQAIAVLKEHGVGCHPGKNRRPAAAEQRVLRARGYRPRMPT